MPGLRILIQVSPFSVPVWNGDNVSCHEVWYTKYRYRNRSSIINFILRSTENLVFIDLRRKKNFAVYRVLTSEELCGLHESCYDELIVILLFIKMYWSQWLSTPNKWWFFFDRRNAGMAFVLVAYLSRGCSFMFKKTWWAWRFFNVLKLHVIYINVRTMFMVRKMYYVNFYSNLRSTWQKCHATSINATSLFEFVCDMNATKQLHNDIVHL